MKLYSYGKIKEQQSHAVFYLLQHIVLFERSFPFTLKWEKMWLRPFLIVDILFKNLPWVLRPNQRRQLLRTRLWALLQLLQWAWLGRYWIAK